VNAARPSGQSRALVARQAAGDLVSAQRADRFASCSAIPSSKGASLKGSFRSSAFHFDAAKGFLCPLLAQLWVKALAVEPSTRGPPRSVIDHGNRLISLTSPDPYGFEIMKADQECNARL